MRKLGVDNKFYRNSQDVSNCIKKHLGDNYLGLILCGSTGRDCHIDGWSDLDFCCIVEHIDIEKISIIRAELRGSLIKVGVSFFAKKEWEAGLLTRHALLTVYEISKGYHYIVYEKEKLTIPKADKKQILDCKQEFLIVYQNFKRTTFESDYRRVYKSILLLKKQLLYFKGIIETDFDTIDLKMHTLYGFMNYQSKELIFNKDKEKLISYALSFSNFLNTLDLPKIIEKSGK